MELQSQSYSEICTTKQNSKNEIVRIKYDLYIVNNRNFSYTYIYPFDTLTCKWYNLYIKKQACSVGICIADYLGSAEVVQRLTTGANLFSCVLDEHYLLWLDST